MVNFVKCTGKNELNLRQNILWLFLHINYFYILIKSYNQEKWKFKNQENEKKI